jgi:hypothetical protein
LRQTVPEDARTEQLTDLIELLGNLVREVDSSLLDEWESLVDPDAAESDGQSRSVTADPKALRVLVRNAMFRRVQLAAARRWYELGELDETGTWDAERWAGALEPYFAEFDEIRADAHARGPKLFVVTERPGIWQVRQVLADPDDNLDWAIHAEVDLDASLRAGSAVLTVTDVARQD